MKSKAIFPGSFDPFHAGHEQVVKQALKLFDTVYVVVTKNPDKKPKFSFAERVSAIENRFKDEPRVIVLLNKNQLTADFAYDLNVHFLVRGIRNNTDFNYEYKMAETNKALNSNLETVFFFADPLTAKISSTFIKQIKEIKGENYGN